MPKVPDSRAEPSPSQSADGRRISLSRRLVGHPMPVEIEDPDRKDPLRPVPFASEA